MYIVHISFLLSSFLTQMDAESISAVERLIRNAIFDGNAQFAESFLSQKIPLPACKPGEVYECVEGYWMLRGPLAPHKQTHYILTPTVVTHLKTLARILSLG